MPVLPFEADATGICLRVRLTPRGGRDAIDGFDMRGDGLPILKARVRAAPEKGLANAALERLIANTLGVPKTTVSVSAGETARTKTLLISGDPERLAGLCQAVFAALVRPPGEPPDGR